MNCEKFFRDFLMMRKRAANQPETMLYLRATKYEKIPGASLMALLSLAKVLSVPDGGRRRRHKARVSRNCDRGGQ
jgi:hypothetical protein